LTSFVTKTNFGGPDGSDESLKKVLKEYADERHVKEHKKRETKA